MEITPIRTEQDYREALREVSRFFDNEPEPGTKEGDRFEVMLTLLQAYEERQFPIEAPDPIEAIKFRMEQAGLEAKDLQPQIGRLNRVYEVLGRKRSLTLNMIRRLHKDIGIPAESLIGELRVVETRHKTVKSLRPGAVKPAEPGARRSKRAAAAPKATASKHKPKPAAGGPLPTKQKTIATNPTVPKAKA